MVPECIHGPMVDNTRVNEKIIKCMGKANLNGRMEENIRGIIMRIKNMEMGIFNGRMEGGIVANG